MTNLLNLIKIQKEYIELLSNALNKNASFLMVHHITADKEDVEKGRELRAKIKELEDKIKEEKLFKKTG